MSTEAGFLSEFDHSGGDNGDHASDRMSGRAPDGTSDRAPDRTDTAGGRWSDPTARCGPELVAPEGIEAQTCVMAQGGETWARTYYRNTTGEELRSVLTLMGPGGRTVELRCPPVAHDEPGSCETPRSPSAGAPHGYTAVAEFAGAGAVEDVPLLLRAGSERAPGAPG